MWGRRGPTAQTTCAPGPIPGIGSFMNLSKTKHRRSMARWVRVALPVVVALFAVTVANPGSAQTKTPPYWASISVNEARTRVGPSLDYPSTWVYRRKDLPVRVVKVHSNWRRIEDPSGTQGWMHVRLLSDTPTAMVTAPEGAMHEGRSESSPLLFLAEKGVVGRVSDCGDGWCRFDVGGKRGFIRTSQLWGAVE